MIELAEWLLARIAEDESSATAAEQSQDPWCWGGYKRVLAECEAKRSVVRWADAAEGGWGESPHYVLELLAEPYADHPDYREEWRP